MQEKNELIKLVSESNSLSEILRKQGKSISGSSMSILKSNLNNYNIKYHFLDNKQSSNLYKKKTLSDILTENSTYSSHYLKLRLIKEGLKKDFCEICGQNNIWNNIKLSLQLDHINGNHYDNRLENLRIVCPNCHTQTSTFSSKKRKIKHFCIDCNKTISRTSIRCNHCARIYHSKHKVPIELLPSKEELKKMIFSISFTEIGKKYNVSDSCIRKWCKKENLPYTKKEIRKLIQKNIAV